MFELAVEPSRSLSRALNKRRRTAHKGTGPGGNKGVGWLITGLKLQEVVYSKSLGVAALTFNQCWYEGNRCKRLGWEAGSVLG